MTPTPPALVGISSRVTCVVALAGHFDLTIPYPKPFDQESVTRLLGGSIDEVPDKYRDASPLTWVDEESAPFLVIHGGADDRIPVDHARRMVDSLHEAGIAVVYTELPGEDHFSAANWEVAGPWTLTFFGVHLDPVG